MWHNEQDLDYTRYAKNLIKKRTVDQMSAILRETSYVLMLFYLKSEFPEDAKLL